MCSAAYRPTRQSAWHQQTPLFLPFFVGPVIGSPGFVVQLCANTRVFRATRLRKHQARLRRFAGTRAA